MFLELAIADAYAAGFVNCSENFINNHNDITAYPSSSDRQDAIGRYTGITQSNIAIARMLILDRSWATEYLANSLLTTCKRDPREGYGDELDRLLQKSQSGNKLLQQIDPFMDLDNPAIRAMAVGKRSTPKKVIKASMTQAAITNNHPDSLNAAIAVALMCHFFIYNLGKKERLKDFLNIYIVTDWLQTSELSNQNLITTKTAIELVIEHQSLSELLQHCISLGQHRNCIAAIAVAAASCSQEYQQDLPQSFSENLENDTEYGRDYLIGLDEKLQLTHRYGLLQN